MYRTGVLNRAINQSKIMGDNNIVPASLQYVHSLRFDPF